jgi:hypothetical protein
MSLENSEFKLMLATEYTGETAKERHEGIKGRSFKANFSLVSVLPRLL